MSWIRIQHSPVTSAGSAVAVWCGRTWVGWRPLGLLHSGWAAVVRWHMQAHQPGASCSSQGMRWQEPGPELAHHWQHWLTYFIKYWIWMSVWPLVGNILQTEKQYSSTISSSSVRGSNLGLKTMYLIDIKWHSLKKWKKQTAFSFTSEAVKEIFHVHIGMIPLACHMIYKMYLMLD